jgi:hypothetical protein
VRRCDSDTAIRREARYRRCKHTDSADFVAELFSDRKSTSSTRPAHSDSRLAPEGAIDDSLSPADRQKWLEEFGINPDDDEPFPGHDAMIS